MKRCRFVSYWADAKEALPVLLADCPPPAGWSRVFLSQRLAIFCSDVDHAIGLPYGRGVVLGEIHTHENYPHLIQSADDMPPAIGERVSSEQILHEIWGRYTAFLVEKDDLLVLRDPSGGLPCYFAATSTGVVHASDARLLMSTIRGQTAIDWDILIHHLVFGSLPTSRTALMGINEILPGFIARWTPDGHSMASAWNPWRWSGHQDESDPGELGARLRFTVEQSALALARTSAHVLLTASGGLDSSIVAACLAQHRQLTLLTLATLRAEGDERTYARDLARHLNLELIEAFFEPGKVDLSQSNARHLPRPTGYTYGQIVDQVTRDVAINRGCDSYFTGNGGDNVFCYLTSASPVVDRWMASGPGAGLASTIRDIRTLTGVSLQTVVAKAVKRHLGDSRYRWPVDHRFLGREVGRDAAPAHPWLDAPPGTFPGKAAHIAVLLKAQPSLENSPKDVPMITPLLSQPVLEMCLAIPSWQWCVGGVNRAIARIAFRDSLPPLVLRRTTKTGPGSFMADIFEKNRSEIRDRLYNGTLTRQGILDIPSLDSLFLSASSTTSGHDFRRAMTLLDAEAWVHSWT